MKCRCEKRLRRNSDWHTPRIVGRHRQIIDQVDKTINRFCIREGFSYFIGCTREVIYFHALNIEQLSHGVFQTSLRNDYLQL